MNSKAAGATCVVCRQPCGGHAGGERHAAAKAGAKNEGSSKGNCFNNPHPPHRNGVAALERVVEDAALHVHADVCGELHSSLLDRLCRAAAGQAGAARNFLVVEQMTT